MSGEVPVSKCCPSGWAYGLPRGTCQPLQDGLRLAWNLTFHRRDQDGHLQELQEETLPVHHRPNCSLFRLDHQDPEEDQAYLLESGSVFVPAWLSLAPPHGLYPPGDYCLEHDLRYLQQYQDRPYLFLCFHDEPREPAAPSSVFAYSLAALICALASDLCLLLTLILFALLPDMRNLYGKVLMNHVTSLLCAYLAVTTRKFLSATPHHLECQVIAILMHFFFLSAFSWLTIMCYDMWCRFRKLLPPPDSSLTFRLLAIYCGVAWGGPLLLLALSLTFNYVQQIPDSIVKTNYGQDFACWIKGWKASLLYFYGPVGVMLLVNFIFFVLTAVNICTAKKSGRDTWKSMENGRHLQRNQRKNRQRFSLYVKLFVVMGMLWIMEVVAWVSQETLNLPEYYFYLSDLLNTLQGVFIFLVSICKRHTLLKVRSKLGLVTKGLLGHRSSGGSSMFASSTNTSQNVVMTEPSACSSSRRKSKAGECPNGIPQGKINV